MHVSCALPLPAIPWQPLHLEAGKCPGFHTACTAGPSLLLPPCTEHMFYVKLHFMGFTARTQYPLPLAPSPAGIERTMWHTISIQKLICHQTAITLNIYRRNKEVNYSYGSFDTVHTKKC